MDEKDLDILDNLAAADPNAPAPSEDAVQDNPVHHVNEEDLRTLDTLMIEMPAVQEQADKAAQIATEAIGLRQRGRIHALEAETLAQMVPAIQGTPEEPVSYTTVPTAVGVNHAVEILETEAHNAIEIAASKASECIDRAVNQIPASLTKFENEFAAATGSYLAAREACNAATGGLPESNYAMHLGDEPAPRVLGRLAGTQADATTGGALLAYTQAFVPLVGTAFDGYHLFRRPVSVRVGENLFLCDDLLVGEVKPLQLTTESRSPTFAATLTAPMLVYPETAEQLQKALGAASQQLSAIKVVFDGHESVHDGLQVIERTALVTKASVLISLVRNIQASLDRIVKLTQAATKFYEDCAKGAVVTSTERYKPAVLAKPGRLFA